MKFYMIAGEASGDLHGSNLIRELHKLYPDLLVRCWGGDMMQKAGATLVKHYRQLAFMGFAEVILNLPTILKNFRFCKHDIKTFKPDAIIFIDYPGFNLPMAKWAKVKGYKTIFYISPQVWAWKESRVKSMKRCIDLMMVILPFEKDYFKTKWNWDVVYVGHPLVKVINDFQDAHPAELTQEKNLIALLPGSRKQEINKKLPVMLSVIRHFPQHQFAIAKAPALETSFYKTFLQHYADVSIEFDAAYNLLNKSAAALVTSGTATLETALFNVPEVVCYKGSNISYQIAKRLIKIRFISLVNLIMDKEVVKELIQDNLTEINLSIQLNMLLSNKQVFSQIHNDYLQLKQMLSKGGNASYNAALCIFNFVQA